VFFGFKLFKNYCFYQQINGERKMAVINRKGLRRQRGQAFVEYVILIALIALASIVVISQFSDRLRDIVAGVTNTLGGDAQGSDEKSSMSVVKEIDASGIEDIQ
jgi:Flp pilus assembly pilin Flp